MNPVVVLCSHERCAITKANLKTIFSQTVKPKVVLVVSATSEAADYTVSFAGEPLTVGIRPNEPLGAKWQSAVDLALSKHDPDAMIITGSDDILGTNFVEQACSAIDSGIGFIGLKRWWVYHPQTHKLYLVDYLNELPLGGGRVYSKALLRHLDGQIFNKQLNRLLDDKGWFAVQGTNFKSQIIREVEEYEMNILAVKGEWPVMNPFDKMFSHPNARVLKRFDDPDEILKTLFNYDSKTVL